MQSSRRGCFASVQQFLLLPISILVVEGGRDLVVFKMGRAPCCDKANVKKGPWSPEEDAKLKSFIQQNGTGGNWITLPSKAGLKRCGKSCRLRWINYLRPDIKHGSFSEEEEKTIYRLHAQIGSRWSLIAAQLPGRTDNDIKNYWNTRLKKKLVERSNAGHYGRPHPYHGHGQIPAGAAHLFNQVGLPDPMASAATRDGQLHGQQQQHSSYTMNQQQSYYHLYQQQREQYLLLRQQQQQEHQLQQQQHHQYQLMMENRNQPGEFPADLLRLISVTGIKHEAAEEHQRQPTTTPVVAPIATSADEAERQRLMVIESSLRSMIVTDEEAACASASGHHGGGGTGDRTITLHMSTSSGNNNTKGIIRPPTGSVAIRPRLRGNSMSPVAVATHRNTTASPTSSCSNLSSDRNSFGVQMADSAFSDTGFNALEDRATRDPAASMLNTSILGPQTQVSNLQQSPAATPDGLLTTTKFDENVLFAEDLAVYNSSQGLSEASDSVDHVKEESGAAAAGPGAVVAASSGDWWSSMDLVSPPRNNNLNPSSVITSRAATMLPPLGKWSIGIPRCGAENMYTTPQAQLASQGHGAQHLDGVSNYTDGYFSKLII